MYKNPIIVFEGIEGSGKTFHINNVSRYLKKRKIKYIKIREPGGTTNSEKIRKLILNKNLKNLEFAGFLRKSRNQHFSQIQNYDVSKSK